MFGIDLSHHQAPASLPWARFKASSDFCIVRTTYGSKLRDRHCAEHLRRAREAGLQVGLYAFFRPSQDVEEQIKAFRAAAQASGYRPGDIVPALDVEADPLPKLQAVTPAWERDVKRFADAITYDFGTPCIVYITQREFGQLGKPGWILGHPLWCAHYTGAAKPATPGNQPALIWQHRVAIYDPNGPGGYDETPPPAIDQNRAFGTLPVSTRVPWGIVPPPAPALLEEEDDDGWDELCLPGITAEDRALIASLQVDVVGALRADGMREMAGLETQPPPELEPHEPGGEV